MHASMCIMPCCPCLPVSTSQSMDRRWGSYLPLDNKYFYLVGSLNHLSWSTRPDITYAVSPLSKFLITLQMAHWGAAVHVLHVRRSAQHSITYGIADYMTGWSVASYAKGLNWRQGGCSLSTVELQPGRANDSPLQP